MPPTALGLLLLSAVIHVTWNVWLKGSGAKLAFLWLGQTAAIFIYIVPVALTTSLAVPANVWPILLVSALCETGYMVAITRAYGVGDMSLVYPLARGSAPIFLTLGSALFIGERLPILGYLSILLLVSGVYLVSLTSSNDILRPLKALRAAEARWALTAGLFIATYSYFDKVGVSYMTPAAYNLWAFIAMTLVSAPVVVAIEGRRKLIQTAREQPRQVVLAGVFVMGAYFLVIMALSMAPASYVGAVRGTSILFGTAWAWRFLGERFSGVRVLGAGLMVAGLIILALGG